MPRRSRMRLNLRAAGAVGIDPRGCGAFAAIAPIVGTARVASATALQAIALQIEVAELEDEAALDEADLNDQ